MWPFKKKEEKEEEKKEERKFVFPTPEEILNGGDPWVITKYTHDPAYIYYEIKVFRFDLSQWTPLSECSEKIIGVDRDEFFRIMYEHFGAIRSREHHSKPVFKTEEEVWNVINEFRPYYQSFHLPRALMGRLSCYTEGGYPPYFKSHLDKMDMSNVKSEKVITKTIKLRRVK